MNYSRFAAALYVALLLSACERPDPNADRAEREERVERRRDYESRRERDDEGGSTKSIDEVRNVENFDSIELRGAAKLNITVGPATSLNISGSERVLKRVDTRVHGDKLVISVDKSRSWFTNQGSLVVNITTPTLKSLESNGAGEIDIKGLNGGEQRLELAGAHQLNAEGHVDKLRLKLSGAGDVDLNKLTIAEARVTVNGAGNVELHVTDSLRAEVNGVGAVTYSGDPLKVESELHGLGSISRRDGDKRDDKDQDKDPEDDKANSEAVTPDPNKVADEAEKQKRG